MVANIQSQPPYSLIYMIQQFSRLALSSQDYLFSQIGDSQLPSQYQDDSQIDRLDCLLVNNFKSFDQKYVGPFLNFTCVIGPNGSGKSNILDALMFCFCSEGSKHSLLDARELINRQGKQSFKQLSRQNKVCSVEARFLLRGGAKFTICRTLDAEAKQQYLVDFKSVSKRVYQNILLRKGINCATPNYAIWQGEIDRLVLRDPLQLTGLLENLSGSIYFKKPYEEVQQKLKLVQTTIEDKSRRINKFKMEKRNIKALKHTSEEYSKYEQQYMQVLNKIYMLEVLTKERNIEELVEEVRKIKQKQATQIQQINAMKQKAQKDHQAKKKLQQQLSILMTELTESYGHLQDIGSHANILKIQKLKEVKEQYLRLKQEQRVLEQQRQDLQQRIPNIPPNKLLEQYLQAYQVWEEENAAVHRELTKRKNELLYLQGILQSKHELARDLDAKKAKHTEKMQLKAQNVKVLKQDISRVQKSIDAMQEETLNITDRISKSQAEIAAKQKAYDELCSTLEDLESVIAEQAQDDKEAEVLRNLANLQGFCGAVHQKIKPNAAKYDVCFNILFTSISKYLLCQSEEASKKIGNRLKEIRMMKNVIILENVSEKRSADLRKSLGKDAVMALDIVDFDRDTRGLKEYLGQFLHGKVVCDNLATAYKIRNKNIDGVRQIYTLDGNVIKRDGSISTHGNLQSIKKAHKYSHNSNKSTIYQDIAKVNKDREKIENELKSMQIKFGLDELARHRSEIEKMGRNKQKLVLKLEELQSYQDKEPALPASLQNEIRDLEKQKDKINKILTELQKSVGSSKAFDKFLKSNKIESLQMFRKANNFELIEKDMKTKSQIQREITNLEHKLDLLDQGISRKGRQLQLVQKQLQSLPQAGDKTKIQKIIADKEKQVVEIRNKMAKLTTINQSLVSFQSALPPMEAKLSFAKQKLSQDLQQLADSLGIEFEYPVPEERIKKLLNLPRKVSERTLEALGEKLEQERAKIEEQLDKYNSINLLVNIQEDEKKIAGNLDDALGQIDSIIKERQKLREELEGIKKDRASLLVEFVNNLRQHLNASYSLLTQQEDGSAGTVTIHIENQQEPFEHGIYFTPTPPTKRFVYDLQQLSGGQKSIASLALQYSLSLATKSPLLILDETDAFLDFANVARFLNLINDSLRSHKIQMLIVTHKQGLFSKCESLVGVSRPKSLNLSQVYSLKLQQE